MSIFDSDLASRVVRCENELRTIKTSQIISSDNYRVYNFTGSASTTARYGAGGDIIFTAEKSFPLASLISINFYLNDSKVNFTRGDFDMASSQWCYETSDGSSYSVGAPLPNGQEEANVYKIEIRIVLQSGSSPVSLRYDYALRANCSGMAVASLSSY